MGRFRKKRTPKDLMNEKIKDWYLRDDRCRNLKFHEDDVVHDYTDKIKPNITFKQLFESSDGTWWKEVELVSNEKIDDENDYEYRALINICRKYYYGELQDESYFIEGLMGSECKNKTFDGYDGKWNEVSSVGHHGEHYRQFENTKLGNKTFYIVTNEKCQILGITFQNDIERGLVEIRNKMKCKNLTELLKKVEDLNQDKSKEIDEEERQLDLDDELGADMLPF